MATLGLFFTLLVSIFLPSWGQIDLGESVTSSSYGDIIDCPPKEVIYPCQCWESTLYDAWQMQCDSVYSESELANVFHKDLGTKTIGNLMVYGNIFLRKLHNGVFGDYKFKTFEVLFTSLVSMEPDVLINSTEILRELTVAFTSISEVPVDYRFQNLEFLQLKGNKIPSMPILDLQALNTLDMGWNPLKEIPSDPFRNLPNLKRLGLSGCQIQSLPQKLFAYPEKMEYMEMFENEIRHISEDTFSGLTAITTLDLSQNQISTVAPGAFTGLSNAELGLQDNAITTLEEEILATNTKQQCLHLVGR
ncbi:unnamed protein product [Meganyctiphanes norvegica]|uniref:Uncharacterized protein n=1 Tax=Meganyctiphanes norvegica TaxID=48144 RepID=A0AAV2RCR5_MEGNR